MISALNSKGGAEMTTDQGAIYVTDNAAYTWTAAVQETVDATLNRTVSSGNWVVMMHGGGEKTRSNNWGMIKIQDIVGQSPPPYSAGISGASYYEGSFSNVARNQTGEYVAVSSRGNFFMTWEPGQTFWQPHNRPAARRVQVGVWLKK